MATFGWFGDQEHRVFNYKPRYYDPEKEARKRMFGAVDGTQDGKGKEEKPMPPAPISRALSATATMPAAGVPAVPRPSSAWWACCWFS